MQSSWQAQHFVNLHVQSSWQAQSKMRFQEIADARNAVFFYRRGGSEAWQVKLCGTLCARRSQVILGSWSDHFRNRPSWRADVVAGTALCEPPCADYVAGAAWQAQNFVNLHVQISWQAQHFVNLHVQIS